MLLAYLEAYSNSRQIKRKGQKHVTLRLALLEEHTTTTNYESYIEGLEKHKKKTPAGVDYWMARDLMALLEYGAWRNFRAVIDKARDSAKSTGISVTHHFVETDNVIQAGKGAQLTREDWFLTRYACYLLAMNADPAKASVGFAQTYFAVQTRKQELGEQQKRLRVRLRIIEANKNLNSTAKRGGVERFALFHDAGYRPLYGGRGLSEIKRYKKLHEKEELLDRAGPAELAINEFRITQTDLKILKERIKGEAELIATHRTVGQEIRDLIDRVGGTMPEDLPIEPSIKPLLDKHRRDIRNGESDQLPS